MMQWNSWSEADERIKLHGVTPGFAQALGASLDAAERKGTAREKAATRPTAGRLRKRGGAGMPVLNVRPDPLDIRDRYYEAPLIALPLRRGPVELDTLGLTVRDQGEEGSCTGQALAAVIDLQNAQRRMTRLDQDAALVIPTQVSARMLYENARGFDEYPDDGLPGSSVRGAIKGFFHNGVCDAELAPYFPGETGWTMTVAMGKQARSTALGSYYRLRHILNDYHAALTETEAILCSAMLHEGWIGDAVSEADGNIRMEKKPEKRRLLGAHAFAIVGYDSNGFFVLNSWGAGWGGCAARRAGADVPQPGLAHWSYEDWQSHVLDAWALRLSTPFPNAFGMTGGFMRPQARSIVPTAIETREVAPPPPSTSRQQIVGHYIHLDDGALVPAAPYPSSLASVRETADYLVAMDGIADADKRYDHLVFYAHGGLNTLAEAANRMAAMTPAFKRNGVYPIFFLWRTGFMETLGDLVRSFAGRAFARTGGITDISDTLIENAAQRIGAPVWGDMKSDAARCFNRTPHEGWEAARILLTRLAERTRHPVKLHFIGHSAGAILLGEMLEKMRKADAAAKAPPVMPQVGTMSLMAPACRMDFFDARIASLNAGGGEVPDCATYILPDSLEQEDDLFLYRRSLLYFISNGLEGTREVPLAGMQRFWKGGRPGWTTVVSDAASKLCRATTHGGFDNDAPTMNAILSRIRGRPTDETNGGFTTADLFWE